MLAVTILHWKLQLDHIRTRRLRDVLVPLILK